MRIDIVTLFPEMFDGPFGHSILKRARDAQILDIRLTNPRRFTDDKHHITDDTPYGGGAGMVMKPEPLFRAVAHIAAHSDAVKRRVLLTCPGGPPLTQDKCKELARYDQLILLCGHYEGVDGRVAEYLADETISIGDYVLTGGELPAMVVVDAVARMLPGVLGCGASAGDDSFYRGLLEYPQYTRPYAYEGMKVPDILLSGHHARIEAWRRRQSLKNTLRRRPDLLAKAELSARDREILAELMAEQTEAES